VLQKRVVVVMKPDRMWRSVKILPWYYMHGGSAQPSRQDTIRECLRDETNTMVDEAQNKLDGNYGALYKPVRLNPRKRNR
jgi:hypothetical protein